MLGLCGIGVFYGTVVIEVGIIVVCMRIFVVVVKGICGEPILLACFDEGLPRVAAAVVGAKWIFAFADGGVSQGAFMGKSFFPNTDSGALAWAQHFSSMISLSPITYGLVAGDAAAFAALVADYQTALAVCEPTIRNKASTAAKKSARAALKLSASRLASIIGGQSTVNDAQKIALGLTVRGKPSPIPAPGNPPELDIISVTGRTVKIRVHNNVTMKRALPAGVSGWTLFSFVGATAPGDLTAWTFQGNSSKTVTDVTFPATATAGAAVWLLAFWYNGKGQSGPACAPVNAYLGGGSVSMAA